MGPAACGGRRSETAIGVRPRYLLSPTCGSSKNLDRGAPNPRVSSPPQSPLLLFPNGAQRAAGALLLSHPCHLSSSMALQALQIKAAAGGARTRQEGGPRVGAADGGRRGRWCGLRWWTVVPAEASTRRLGGQSRVGRFLGAR
jgi:hypothetical protein